MVTVSPVSAGSAGILLLSLIVRKRRGGEEEGGRREEGDGRGQLEIHELD